MKILMVSSEVEPYSKSGGLADVLGSLPRALVDLGHEVAVVSPRYRMTKLEAGHTAFGSLTVRIGGATHSPKVVALREGALQFYFVDYPPFFDRDGLYGDTNGDFGDNAQRFFLLSRAAIEIAKLDCHPDLIHCHEWQSAMVPVLLKTVYAKDEALQRTPVVFTIHNLGYQGVFDASLLGLLGLPGSLFSVDGLEYHGNVSFIKGALLFSDVRTTVSKAYAEEIKTEQYGLGLEGVIRARSDSLYGVLNGVNYQQWDPSSDPRIAARYSADDLRGKVTCKRDLLNTFGLPRKNWPLIGMIARLAWQKGAELIGEAGERLMQRECSLVFLGEGDASTVEMLARLQKRYPERVGFHNGFDEDLAHKIEAGADIFLMPSRYEPCGLNQMYSLKYGTVPVVRATGGLDDTVEEFDPKTGQGTGFKFKDYSAAAMLAALDRALVACKDRKLWRKLMRNGMKCDYSWRSSALKYERIYQQAVTEETGMDSR